MAAIADIADGLPWRARRLPAALAALLVLAVGLFPTAVSSRPTDRGYDRAANRSGPPSAAIAAGYTVNTFSSRANFGPTTVDSRLSYAPGYQWYFWNFFGVKPSFDTTKFNPDGSISVGTLPKSANGTLVSAARIRQAPYFVGQAFGGGGYFEAEISFDPSTIDQTKGFPAWWMMALEHLDGLPGQHWPGQKPGYVHFMEVDIFEYIRKRTSAYGGTLHDWFGIPKVTCPNASCELDSQYDASTKEVPPATDWKGRTHRLGVLWLPASDHAKGSLTFYFDGRQEGDPISFSKYVNQPPPLTASTPWNFGVIDQQHMVLILGTGPGDPLMVRSVNVWQASAAANLRH